MKKKYLLLWALSLVIVAAVAFTPAVDAVRYAYWKIANGVLVPVDDGVTVSIPGAVSMGGTGVAGKKIVIRQSDDLDGIRIYGYDDRSAAYADISINDVGRLEINSSAGTVYLPSHIALTNTRRVYYGTSFSYWDVYNSTSTQVERWSTDVDGSGTDGLIFSIPDGTDDVNFHGAGVFGAYLWQDDFDEEAAAVELNNGLRTDEWTEGGTNSATANVTYTAGAGGTLALVTAGTDDDSQFILHLPNVRVDSNPVMEARFKITDITNAYVAIGFVEGSYVDKATHDDDIALVGFDSDNGHTFGAAQLVGIFNDNNGGVDYDNTGVAIVANTYVIVRIDLTNTEQPKIWINNTEVLAASITGTVQAATTLMPYFMVQSLSGAADTATIDYIKIWQDRG